MQLRQQQHSSDCSWSIGSVETVATDASDWRHSAAAVVSGDGVEQHELPDFVMFVLTPVAVVKEAGLEDSVVERVWRKVSELPVKWSLDVGLKVDSAEDEVMSCCADSVERR